MMTLSPQPLIGVRRPSKGRLLGCLLAACALMSSGCASFSNPVADGIPARRIPVEYLAKSKAELRTIPLTTLGQPQPDNYRFGPGDVLGVFIEGVLDDKNLPFPVQFRSNEQGNLPPAIGYPIPVREDGTLPLPSIKPLQVAGKTQLETEDAVREAYTITNKILLPGKERIFISLIKKRESRVLVFRQETPQVTLTAGVQSNARRGTSEQVSLPAYENDVMHALARTGGLPGLDSVNEIVIERKLKEAGTKRIRIPLRIREGEEIPFTTKDVLLETGDVVFIEARDTELYYVAGLTIPKQFTLPRDNDLRVSEAIAIAGGPLVNGGVNQNNLSGSVIANGIGSPSPSQVTVLRKTKNNGLIKILVSLNRGLNDPREDIIVMTGDRLVLQETPGESLTRYLSSTIRFNFFNRFIQGNNTNAFVNANLP